MVFSKNMIQHLRFGYDSKQQISCAAQLNADQNSHDQCIAGSAAVYPYWFLCDMYSNTTIGLLWQQCSDISIYPTNITTKGKGNKIHGIGVYFILQIRH